MSDPAWKKDESDMQTQDDKIALETINPERFWSKVRRGSEQQCWEWQACLARGYGLFRVRGALGRWRMQGAHRMAWLLTKGPIPTDLCVLHKCDNRRCANPNHLFLGTRGDNARDKAAKGRARGQWHPRSILTDDAVREIRKRRESGEKLTSIASDFGIAMCTVSAVALRRLWPHIG